MKLVYIAGKYSAPSFHETHLNIWAAREYAMKVWELGAAAICPHLNTYHFEADTKLTQQNFYDGDLEILRRCDAILLIPGWGESKGARMECRFALRHDIPVFHDIESLKGWLVLHEAAESKAAARP